MVWTARGENYSNWNLRRRILSLNLRAVWISIFDIWIPSLTLQTQSTLNVLLKKERCKTTHSRLTDLFHQILTNFASSPEHYTNKSKAWAMTVFTKLQCIIYYWNPNLKAWENNYKEIGRKDWTTSAAANILIFFLSSPLGPKANNEPVTLVRIFFMSHLEVTC